MTKFNKIVKIFDDMAGKYRVCVEQTDGMSRVVCFSSEPTEQEVELFVNKIIESDEQAKIDEELLLLEDLERLLGEIEGEEQDE